MNTGQASPSPLQPPADVVLTAEELSADTVERLRAHLAGHGLRIDGEVAPRRFAGGLANRNYLLRLDDGWAVLRRPPDGPLPPGAHDMAREHRILKDLWRKLPVAARSLHLCEDRAVLGVPFQILEFRSGVAIRGDRLEPLPETPSTGRALSDILLETLARIHAVDPASVGLGDLGRPEGFFARQTAGWLRRAEAAGDGLPVAARDVAAWLLAHDPVPDETPVLLHGDFKLDNLLLDRATLTPTAVVDWDMGTRGPALFDLATLLSYWTEPSDPACMHALAQMPTARPGFPGREEAARTYCEAAGRSLDALKPYRVLAMVKIAVVFQQLHRLFTSGEVTDPRYAGFGELSDGLFLFANEAARGRIF